MDTEPKFSFCESVHATGTSPWHIRRLTDEEYDRTVHVITTFTTKATEQ